MDSSITEFLAADDLDLLVEARRQIEEISSQDAAEIAHIIESWSDHQALANLLMYPEILPERIRPGALLRALSGGDGSSGDESSGDGTGYLVLAAVLGVQRLSEQDAIADDVRPDIAEQLMRLLGSPIPIVAARSSIAVEEHIDIIGLGEVLATLNMADDHVFHNVLAVSMRHSGREAVVDTLRELAESGHLDVAVAERAVSQVEQMLGMGALPRLAYIPSLSQWLGVD